MALFSYTAQSSWGFQILDFVLYLKMTGQINLIFFLIVELYIYILFCISFSKFECYLQVKEATLSPKPFATYLKRFRDNNEDSNETETASSPALSNFSSGMCYTTEFKLSTKMKFKKMYICIHFLSKIYSGIHNTQLHNLLLLLIFHMTGTLQPATQHFNFSSHNPSTLSFDMSGYHCFPGFHHFL